MKKLVTIQIELDVPESATFDVEACARSARDLTAQGEFGEVDAFGVMALDYIEVGNRSIAHRYVKRAQVTTQDIIL